MRSYPKCNQFAAVSFADQLAEEASGGGEQIIWGARISCVCFWLLLLLMLVGWYFCCRQDVNYTLHTEVDDGYQQRKLIIANK